MNDNEKPISEADMFDAMIAYEFFLSEIIAKLVENKALSDTDVILSAVKTEKLMSALPENLTGRAAAHSLASILQKRLSLPCRELWPKP